MKKQIIALVGVATIMSVALTTKLQAFADENDKEFNSVEDIATEVLLKNREEKDATDLAEKNAKIKEIVEVTLEQHGDDREAFLNEVAEKLGPHMRKFREVKQGGASKSGDGVIQCIYDTITEAGEKGVNEIDIFNALISKFPDRNALALAGTVRGQLGGKKRPLTMERTFKVTMDVDTEDKDGNILFIITGKAEDTQE